MAETNCYLNQARRQNPSLQSLFQALDPISLILSQNSADSDQPVPLKLTTESHVMERGPRYRAYAELRERKLRMKMLKQQEYEETDLKQTTTKKQVKFHENLENSRKGPSILAQSVPDFSATLRKENRKPRQELTPPSKKVSKTNNGFLSGSRGSKSANAGEKKNGGFLMARKSYASLEELKGLSLAAANAINDDSRGNRGGRGAGVGIGKTVLGY
ncbi:hypothetical protein OIU74_003723 [Salix koriyanagi]|uniref:Uncharacterized protein n=1 Tax=Salix koriyanagi TaxID=2511006 RepID=A0A9Q0ZLE1_9ROSI|nr:hypothetical protein OIU74_003723 [Salix koriyanagi]